MTLDQVLDAVMGLSIEQQEMLLDIVHRRHIENRRKEIAEDARKSLAAFHAGELKPQPVKVIISELRRSLQATNE